MIRSVTQSYHLDKIILGISIPLGIIGGFLVFFVIVLPSLPERIPQHGVVAAECNDVYCADNYIGQCKPSYITLTSDTRTLLIQIVGNTGEGIQNLPANSCWLDVQERPLGVSSQSLPYYECMIPLDKLDGWNSWSIDSDSSTDDTNHIKEIQEYCMLVDNPR